MPNINSKNSSSSNDTATRWLSSMLIQNGKLDKIRKFHAEAKNSKGETKILDESWKLWSVLIFDGYGYVLSEEEYQAVAKLSSDENRFTNTKNAKNLYEEGEGSQYGIYYSSYLLFDENKENNEEGIKILENESNYFRSKLENGEESPSKYPQSPSADFILGKYYSDKDINLALDYYDSALHYYDSFLDGSKKETAKICYIDSCLNLLKSGKKDETFLENLANSVHNSHTISDFCKKLDNRLDEGDSDLIIDSKTWVDVQSHLVNTTKSENISKSDVDTDRVWNRIKTHLETGKLKTDDVFNFVIKSNNKQYNKEGYGYELPESCSFIQNMWKHNYINDIDEINSYYDNLTKNYMDKGDVLKNYANTIYSFRTSKGNFSLNDQKKITDYVFSSYKNLLETKEFIPQLYNLYKYSAIDKSKITETNLGETNYKAFHAERVKDYYDNNKDNPRGFDLTKSLVYLAANGIDEQKNLVEKFLKSRQTSLHERVVNSLKDYTNKSAEERKTLFEDYEKYLATNNNSLSEEEREELKEIYTKISDDYNKELIEKSKKEGEDVLKTIDKLVEEKKITKGEAEKLKSEMIESGEIPITDAEMEVTFENEKGETTTLDFTADGWYEKILNFSFKNNKSSSGGEIIDVVSDYGWMNNTTNKNTSLEFIKYNNIPYCYAIEYRQLYNASISNILISLIGLVHNAKAVISGGYKFLTSLIDKIASGWDAPSLGENLTADGGTNYMTETGKWMVEAGNNISKEFSKAMSAATKIDSNGPIGTSHKSGLLDPYRLMYVLSKTNKQYCFPMLDKSASSYKVSNKMDEKEGGEGTKLLGNRFFGLISNFAQKSLGWAQDINQIAPFLQSAMGESNSVRQYQIERSKYFAYPTEGEEIETTFILYNTVRRDIWKKHFNFIFGFVLRNLPFKHDMVTYYPPLFYDVIIPGVKRSPYCYVERVEVTPFGLMRNMSISSDEIGFSKLTDGGKTNYTVNVPEAWQVKIVFKSLIATSANQILSGFVDMPIQASSSNESPTNRTNNR